jgi:hypothetical protein
MHVVVTHAKLMMPLIAAKTELVLKMPKASQNANAIQVIKASFAKRKFRQRTLPET